MKKVIIVEDNHTLRNGLCENISWKDNDICIAASFDNGLDALKYMKNEAVDVVVTDIVMPLVDGLDLTREVKRKDPSIKVILLSAFNEFEYAKNAIRFGVFDYITKPVDNELLLRTVKAAIEERKNEELLKLQVKKGIPVLREKLLTQLIKGNVEPESFQAECEYLDLQFHFKYYKCIIFEIDQLEKIRRELRIEELQVSILKMSAIIREPFADTCPVIFTTEDYHTVLLLGSDLPDQMESYQILYARLENVKNEIEKRLFMIVTVGIGCQIISVENIGKSFKYGIDALEMKFSMGGGKVFDAKDIKLAESDEDFELPISIQKLLVKNTKYGRQEEVLDCINEFKAFLDNKNARKEYFKLYLLSMLTNLLQEVYTMNINKKELFGLHSGMVLKVEELSTQEEILHEFEIFLMKIYSMIGKIRSHKNSKIIDSVKGYIDEYYSSTGVGLEEISRRVSMSPSYLSAVFKEETGKNLIEYITDIRIKKAQELLGQTDMKIYEVALQVGYANQFYFSACFKKHTGLSPNEFRSNLLQ